MGVVAKEKEEEEEEEEEDVVDVEPEWATEHAEELREIDGKVVAVLSELARCGALATASATLP